jgi:regulator of replication initiation timing
VRYDKLLSKKEYKKKDFETKLSKFMKTLEMTKNDLSEKTTENARLQEKIAGLRGELTLREQVIKRSDGGNLVATKSNMKMKKVVARRQLVDAAQAQAEEIDFLKSELDRLRQKTFPSFVRATRSRLTYNPDERI